MMKKIYTVIFMLFTTGFAAKAQVVINEVYGGGGNSGSTFKNDFIELYNNGNAPVSLAGWSVQYASAAGTSWAATPLTGTIPANGYYLIQEAAGAGGTTYLPTANDSGSLTMSGTAGKVVLVNNSTVLTGDCTLFTVVDKVSFGSTATCFEGTGPAPAPSNINSIQRSPIGNDTQDNSADFVAGAPSPAGSAVVDVTPPAIASLSPGNNATNVGTAFTATITFSEGVVKGTAGSIVVKSVADNSIIQTTGILDAGVTINGAAVSFSITSLALSTAYYVEISSGAFKDVSGNDFAGITGSSTWKFTTAGTVASGSIGSTYDFNSCTASITDGFTAYSVTGTEVWGCTTFGRDPANPAGTTAFEAAEQINGYSAGANHTNEDWFISPSFDLTGTTFPLLSFWSRNAFNGDPLQLKVSVDYPGTGNPNNYTWADVNGRFPGQATNVWSQSQDVNLADFKTTHTYFAFVYHSTTEDGARWTVDDVRIDDSPTAPPASLTTNTTDIQFGFVPVATPSVKSFVVLGNDLTGGVTLTATGNFLISKTNGNFTSSISYTQAEANNIGDTVYVQFLPAQASTNYAGTVTVSTTGTPGVLINLTGNSIDAALTLEVVNWNLEWFGSSDPSLGPSNKALQQTNVKNITRNIGADLFAFAEVVSEPALKNIVDSLNATFGANTYDYRICNYAAHTNPFESGAGPLSAAQKEAFVFKTSVISPISTSALVTNGPNTAADLNNPAYNYFASGRYPFMMYANVTLNGNTKPVRFVELHAKASSSPIATSYARRKAGADTLNYTLNNLYPTDNIVLLGDFNDDLDQSIAAGFTVSSYSTFNNDPADFFSPTLALSLAGKKSTVSYNDMIDHVELSNEMKNFYMANTAAVLTDVSSLVSNYGSTTTDHYPVFTRYSFDFTVLPVSLASFTATKQNSAVVLNWSTSQEINTKTFTVEKSVDGVKWISIGSVNASGNSSIVKAYSFTDAAPANGINYYRLKQIDIDAKFKYSITKTILFSKGAIKISPNPAKSYVTISFDKNNAAPVTINIIDVTGKIVSQSVTTLSVVKMNIDHLAKGTYFVKIFNGNDTSNQKLVIE